MTQTQSFWAAVREQTAALAEDFYYLISVDDPTRCVVGGSVVQVSKQKAAELLVSKTHRIATDDEVAAHLNYEEEQRQKYAEIERKRVELLGFRPPLPAPPARTKTKES